MYQPSNIACHLFLDTLRAVTSSVGGSSNKVIEKGGMVTPYCRPDGRLQPGTTPPPSLAICRLRLMSLGAPQRWYAAADADVLLACR